MFRIVLGEMKKFYKFKIIQLTLLTLIGLMLICGLTSNSLNKMSAFDFPIFILRILGEFYILSFFIAFSSYTMGLEIDCKTIKILKAKRTSAWKVYLSKLITGLSYSAVVFLIIFGVSMIFGLVNLPHKGINISNLNLNITSVKDSAIFVSLFYLKQIMASVFILALSLFITVFTQKKLLSVVIVPIFLMLINMLDNVKGFGFKYIRILLPINSDLLFRELKTDMVTERLLCIFIYSLILIIFGIMYYRRKEIKI